MSLCGLAKQVPSVVDLGYVYRCQCWQGEVGLPLTMGGQSRPAIWWESCSVDVANCHCALGSLELFVLIYAWSLLETDFALSSRCRTHLESLHLGINSFAIGSCEGGMLTNVGSSLALCLILKHVVDVSIPGPFNSIRMFKRLVS